MAYSNRSDYVDAIAYIQPYAQSIVRDESIPNELARLRSYIEAVERVHNREIEILYRLMEERTLILSDVDEIYNDYC